MSYDLADEIEAELARATAKFPDCVKLPDGTGDCEARRTYEAIAKNACDRAYREGRITHAHIFEEEAMEVLAADDVTKLRKELIQVGAMVVKWVRDIDSREAEQAPAPCKPGCGMNCAYLPIDRQPQWYPKLWNGDNVFCSRACADAGWALNPAPKCDHRTNARCVETGGCAEAREVRAQLGVAIDTPKPGRITTPSTVTAAGVTTEIPVDDRLEEAIEHAINRFSRENVSGTPDHILSSYLMDCLRVFEQATGRREDWYGRVIDAPGEPSVLPATRPMSPATENPSAPVSISENGDAAQGKPEQPTRVHDGYRLADGWHRVAIDRFGCFVCGKDGGGEFGNGDFAYCLDCIPQRALVKVEPAIDWSRFVPTEEIAEGPSLANGIGDVAVGDVIASAFRHPDGELHGSVRRVDSLGLTTYSSQPVVGGKTWDSGRTRLIRHADGRWAAGYHPGGPCDRWCGEQRTGTHHNCHHLGAGTPCFCTPFCRDRFEASRKDSAPTAAHTQAAPPSAVGTERKAHQADGGTCSSEPSGNAGQLREADGGWTCGNHGWCEVDAVSHRCAMWTDGMGVCGKLATWVADAGVKEVSSEPDKPEYPGDVLVLGTRAH